MNGGFNMGYILPITNWTYHQYHLRTLTKEARDYSVKRASVVVPLSFDDVLEKKSAQYKRSTDKKNTVNNENEFTVEVKGMMFNRSV